MGYDHKHKQFLHQCQQCDNCRETECNTWRLLNFSKQCYYCKKEIDITPKNFLFHYNPNLEICVKCEESLPIKTYYKLLNEVDIKNSRTHDTDSQLTTMWCRQCKEPVKVWIGTSKDDVICSDCNAPGIDPDVRSYGSHTGGYF